MLIARMNPYPISRLLCVWSVAIMSLHQCLKTVKAIHIMMSLA